MNEKCILQVEDEEADIIIMDFVFRKVGITIPLKVVTDGQMAIDYLSGIGPFADRGEYPLPLLVLLDIKMPKINGLEVLDWIRHEPRFRSVVVIVFSSSALPWDVEHAYALGANSFIQKPANPEKTLEMANLLKGWWLDLNRFAETGCGAT